ncbi:MAG: hypothetical protein Q4C70_08455 [Planctomycetia bacterium]|nr:hypothetical protein [Planctomycetia bacterium]
MKPPVIGNKIYFLLSLLALILWTASVSGQDNASSDDKMLITADLLFPKTTCAYVSVRDIAVLRESWQKTAFGELRNLPEMEKFFQSMQEQLSENLDTFQNRFGVTLNDIGKIADTEIAAALIQLDAKRYGVAVLINVGDKQYETQSVLSKMATRIKENGGTHQKQQIEDAEIHIMNMLDPETKTFQKTYYVLKGELLIASDKPEVIKDVLTRLTIMEKNPDVLPESFSNVDAYLEILNRTIVDETLPDVIWYVDPIRYLQVRRLMEIEKDPEFATKKDTALLLSNAGFDGIEGVGGVVTFNHQGYDCTHRIFVSIPNEAKDSLKMLSFDTKADKEIPDWISSKVGAVHVVNLTVLDMFDNLGPLVNQFFGEGSDTVWDDVLDGFENDPYGPQLNLRKEIFSLLENKIIFMVQNFAPKEIDGERNLIVIPVKDEKRLRENLGTLLNEEPSFEVLNSGDDVAWKFLEEDHEEGSAGSEVKGRRFPELTLSVWNGYFLIASQPDYIDYIKEQKNVEPLSETPLYKLLQKEVGALESKLPHVSFHFVNTEIHREHTYEMTKAGMLAESAATYSATLGDAIRKSATANNTREPLDASELPEFDTVRGYFLPEGGCISPVQGGFYYQGFTMSRDKMGDSAPAVVKPKVKAKKSTK